MLRDCRDCFFHFLLVQDDVFLAVGKDLLDRLITVVAQDESQPTGFDKAILPHPIAQGEDSLAGLVLLTAAWLLIRRWKTKAVFPARQIEYADSREKTSEPNTDTNNNVEMMERICQLMGEQQLFRNSELKVADVAAELGSNSRYVTDCIRASRGITFTQFVNEYRVGYVQQLLQQHPDKKVFETCIEAGFTSERSFFRIFKDVTGMTTTEWLRRIHD